MVGSNRVGGARNIIDSGKKNILNLPYETRRVKRRVKPDQVSSYSLRVHKKPEERNLRYEDLQDRDLDPGQAELGLVPPNYHPFIKESAAKRPQIFAKSVQSRLNDPKMHALTSAFLGQIVLNERPDIFGEIIKEASPEFIRLGLDGLGRSTWRQLARKSDYRDNLHTSNDNWLGELALNANSIYRQGTDVLKLVIPHLDQILDPMDYIQFGDQQMFNTKSPNLLPSRVYPTQDYGVNQIMVGGDKYKTTWIHTPPGKSNILKELEEKFSINAENKGKVTAHPMGFLPKYHNKELSLTPQGLQNSSILIPTESIQRVLAGFMLYNVKGEPLFVYPRLGEHLLTKEESGLRQKMFSLTSKRPTNILNQVKERGSSGYGDNEVDIYNQGQYRWTRGHRATADETALYDTLFPHPLLRHLALSYRDTPTSDTVMESICSLAVASLPMVQK